MPKRIKEQEACVHTRGSKFKILCAGFWLGEGDKGAGKMRVQNEPREQEGKSFREEANGWKIIPHGTPTSWR